MRSILLITGLVVGVSAASANTITFNTPSGSTLGGEPVGGTAVFNVTDANDFTITLSNMVTSIHDAGQLLTDLEFNFIAQNLSLVNSNGALINISSNGTMTSAGVGPTGWGFGSTGPDAFLLCIICGNGVTATAQPSEGMIGPGPFSKSTSNSSILGNTPHNPFLASGAVFSFHTTSDLSNTPEPFSNVIFSFSTKFGANVPSDGGNAQVPEPFTFGLAGAGLVGLALLRRCRS